MTRSRHALGLAIALVLTGLGLSAAIAGQTPPDRRVRALVISSGAFHDYLYQSRVFAQAIGKAVPVDWTIAVQGSDRATTTRFPIYDTADWAKGFDIVVHNECSADVADQSFVQRITAAHANGHVAGMVIHCSMHSYRAMKEDDWREFLGVMTHEHTAQFQIPVRWADDPIVNGLKTGWVTPSDELYVIEKIWPGARAVASATDPKTQREYPVAWVNDYKGARVFGTTLGHGNATWDDPVYQELLVRGFKWAVGK